MRKEETPLLARAVLIGTLAFAGAATAQGMAKEGNYDYNACWSGTSNVINFSKAHTALSYEFLGTTLSNPPGGAFDKQTFRCVGMNYIFEGKVSGSAVCEAVDAQEPEAGHRHPVGAGVDQRNALRGLLEDGAFFVGQ